MENQQKKMDRMKQREEEEYMRSAHNRAYKDQLKNNIELNKRSTQDKVKREVDYVK